MERSKHLRPRKAFILVELLVVIGIIAVLIGILFASGTGKAREQAKTTQCLSNLRQIGASITMYISEQRYMIPAAHFHDGGNPAYWENWATILNNMGYLKNVPTAPLANNLVPNLGSTASNT